MEQQATAHPQKQKRSPKWGTVAAIAGVSLFALASLTPQNVKTENANTTPSQLMGASTQETQAGEEQLVDTPEVNISTEASPTQTYYPTNTLVPTLAPTITVESNVSTENAYQQEPQQQECAGATAFCNDGTCSYSAHHQGTCSHHEGVS
jgi:Protein of unknown function (DUF3761)